MALFFSTHVCSDLCRYLNLTPFKVNQEEVERAVSSAAMPPPVGSPVFKHDPTVLPPAQPHPSLMPSRTMIEGATAARAMDSPVAGDLSLLSAPQVVELARWHSKSHHGAKGPTLPQLAHQEALLHGTPASWYSAVCWV